MDLETLASAGATVPVPGKGELPVRGLTLADITGLVDRHRPSLTIAFDKVKGEAEFAGDPSEIASSLLRTAPELVADIIAIATDQPKKTEAARRMPVSLQLAVLEKVGELTFAAEGGMGKTVEIVIAMFTGTTQVLADLKA